MGTELFYPHWELFEWIERGGSYGAILALWLILPQSSGVLNTFIFNKTVTGADSN